MHTEGWLNAFAGFLVMVGCLAATVAAGRAFTLPEERVEERRTYSIVCTREAKASHPEICAASLREVVCRGLDDFCPAFPVSVWTCLCSFPLEEPAPPSIALNGAEPASRADMLNHLQMIRLEARSPRPVVTPAEALL